MDHVSLNRQRCEEREKKNRKIVQKCLGKEKKQKKKKNANEITDDRSYNTFE